MAPELTTFEDVVCPFCSLACDDLVLSRTERDGIALVGPECPLARSGYIHVETERFSLDHAPEAYARLHAGTLRGRAVVVP